ncbi:MAG TPA: TIGR01777 family oxidoreductase [Bryobacteraceae bacterium]|nr:TIGR01777 family oxidoreductase [Bryobacteraceae bacterium]
MFKIVIPGGSGQVGRMLARHFRAQGHEVRVLSRGEGSWDGRTVGDWVREVEASDVCINLAGRSVNCRYTEANRRAIVDSRVESTRVLGDVIAASKRGPRVWLNASTATIYRHALDRAMDEATGELGGSEPGTPETWNFSIGVAKGWEEAFFASETPRTRKVALRSAITFSPDRGGAFEILSNLVRFGLGGRQGSGRQFVSWVHEFDFVRAVEWLIEREDLSGLVNIASPNPLPNAEFMRGLREAWGVRLGLPAAEWMLEMGAWAMRTETELVLKSRRVVPGRLLESGFAYRYPLWPEAARELVSRYG